MRDYKARCYMCEKGYAKPEYEDIFCSQACAARWALIEAPMQFGASGMQWCGLCREWIEISTDIDWHVRTKHEGMSDEDYYENVYLKEKRR